MKFDFGDEVLLACSRGSAKPPRELGAVVGITLVDNEALLSSTGFPLGTVLYTAEFGDGTDAVVPEIFAQPVSDWWRGEAQPVRTPLQVS